eukprot:7194126-Alexandrium_andersonii.AAC.1
MSASLVGSEMCIRDRPLARGRASDKPPAGAGATLPCCDPQRARAASCAADERPACAAAAARRPMKGAGEPTRQ